MPASLPPTPPLRIDGPLQTLLSEADLSLGRLAGSLDILPNADLFVFMYVRKEAVLSSQIEGTQSSLQDVLSAEAEIFDDTTSRDVGEVMNYVRAMNHGLSRLGSLPVSTRLIREIHRELMVGARGSHFTPGEFRTTQNWIGPGGCSLSDAVFVPPPPGEVLEHLGDLERFIHHHTAMPLLLKIGLVHAQFETIHPFADGNGRVGRLLIALLLCERDILPKPAFYLSHYFKRHRQSYYEHLQAIRERGEYEAWLAFFLKGIAEVSAEARLTARNILLLRESHRQLIADTFGRAAGNGHRTLEHLFQHPIMSINDVSELNATTFPAASSLVGRLVDAGILVEVTGQTRHRKFRYDPYIAIFTNDE